MAPHVCSVLLAGLEDCVKVGAHVSDVVGILGRHHCHVCDEAVGPLEEGIVELVARLDVILTSMSEKYFSFLPVSLHLGTMNGKAMSVSSSTKCWLSATSQNRSAFTVHDIHVQHAKRIFTSSYHSHIEQTQQWPKPFICIVALPLLCM